MPDKNVRVEARRDAESLFAGTPELGAEARMEIYANMYFWRQIDALHQDFPKLSSLVGDAAFCALAEAYIRAYPSEHPSLSRFGRHFAHFMRQRRATRPDLADLAALEWARAEVFEEADASAVSPERLRELGLGDLANQPLTLAPAMRLLHLDYDVLGIWLEIERKCPPSDARRVQTFAAVWRKDYDVFHVRLEPEEALALERAASGQPLAKVCDAFADRSDAVEAAVRAIGSWLAEGWIVQPPDLHVFSASDLRQPK
jgi:hypothetical protein